MAASVPLAVPTITTRTAPATRDDHRMITILDGGTGHELTQRGVSDGTFFAGVLANEKNQTMVEAVHCDFCNSGCDVVTTNSFVAVPLVMRQRGWSADDEAANQRSRELIVASVACAKRAVRSLRHTSTRHSSGITTTSSSSSSNASTIVRGVPLVAGCVPPLTECYVGSKVPNEISELVPIYQFIIETLLTEEVDLLLAETLTTAREAIAILQAVSLVQQQSQHQPLLLTKINVWISFTVDDDSPETLRSGEPLVTSIASVLDTAASMQDILSLDAIGVNCSAPHAISRAIPLIASIIATPTTTTSLQSTLRKPIRVPRILAYGNAFRTTTSEWLRSTCSTDSGNRTNNNESTHADEKEAHSSSIVSNTNANTTTMDTNNTNDNDTDYDKNGCMLPEVYAKYAKEWVEAGASIVGGCCGCTPRHLQEVVANVK